MSFKLVSQFGYIYCIYCSWSFLFKTEIPFCSIVPSVVVVLQLIIQTVSKFCRTVINVAMITSYKVLQHLLMGNARPAGTAVSIPANHWWCGSEQLERSSPVRPLRLCLPSWPTIRWTHTQRGRMVRRRTFLLGFYWGECYESLYTFFSFFFLCRHVKEDCFYVLFGFSVGQNSNNGHGYIIYFIYLSIYFFIYFIDLFSLVG